MRKLEINAPVLLLGIFMLPYIANAPLAIFYKHITKGAVYIAFSYSFTLSISTAYSSTLHKAGA